jgi:hypothetical protein
MARVLETSDPATLLASLARNIPGAIYRCALDRDWTMHLIGEEIERITGHPAEDFVENRRRTFGSVIHAEDREICVHLGRENGCVFVEVTDDGVGGATFDDGSGLRGLRDRLATVRGTVEVASRRGAGTRLLARVPVEGDGSELA